MSKYYTVLAFPNGDQTTSYAIFKGKTALAATHRAEEWVLWSSPDSRGEYEEKHGAVSDDDWLKEMGRCGFTIAPAKFGEYF
jgi:hypothetical protein